MTKGVAEELRKILFDAEQCTGSVREESLDEKEVERYLDDSATPCCHAQEASQFIAEDLSEMTGLDEDTLFLALTEAMKCDSDCGKKYRTEQGGFKGGKGDAFKQCEQYASNCCSGVKDPSAFCAYLGRRSGKIK